MYDSYCFVCSRCTDHVGEHEALVEAGLAMYEVESGTVLKTAFWNDFYARIISDIEYYNYKKEFEL